MQPVEFKVVGLEVKDDIAEIRLHGKLDKVYTSVLFLKVPLDELSKFSIGQIYSLVTQGSVISVEPVPDSAFNLVETVPLDAVKSRFEDGSPVPDDAEAAVERWGGYRL